MRTFTRLAVCVAVAALVSISLPQPGQARDGVTPSPDTAAVYLPTVDLDHWKNTPSDERYAFLVGFLTMLDVERGWQGQDYLPVSQSTVYTWSRGLSGVSIRDMDNAINRYIAANPDKMDRSVAEVLGIIYVRPKMTQDERTRAYERYERIKTTYPARRR